jgi:hypothetical protein
MKKRFAEKQIIGFLRKAEARARGLLTGLGGRSWTI